MASVDQAVREQTEVPIAPTGEQALERLTAEQALAQRPVYYTMHPEKLALVKAMAAKNASDAEVAMFLEIAARYDLAWEAKEIWCVKGDSGQLLVMVARDGLRKIAQRNSLRIDGDVVREYDTFTVTRDPQTRRRVIEHAYAEARQEDEARRAGIVTGNASTRGPIIGAWAECWDRETGEQRGYFYAPMTEYRPTSDRKLQYSPWGSQESVMILAAAERQALRQATPLSGLLAEGEMDLNEDRAYVQNLTDGGNGGTTPEAVYPEGDLGQSLEAMVAEANRRVPGSWRPAKVAAKLGDSEALVALEAELVEFLKANPPTVAEEVTDAVVVSDASVPQEPAQAPEGSQEPAEASAAPQEPPAAVEWDAGEYEQVSGTLADLSEQLEHMDPETLEAGTLLSNVQDLLERKAALEAVMPQPKLEKKDKGK